MRLYMPIPQLVRHLAQDEEVGGQTVPQGSTILVSVMSDSLSARIYIYTT